VGREVEGVAQVNTRSHHFRGSHQVWDKERVGGDDAIGVVLIDINCLLMKVPHPLILCYIFFAPLPPSCLAPLPGTLPVRSPDISPSITPTRETNLLSLIPCACISLPWTHLAPLYLYPLTPDSPCSLVPVSPYAGLAGRDHGLVSHLRHHHE
jgi:hypothetical protein